MSAGFEVSAIRRSAPMRSVIRDIPRWCAGRTRGGPAARRAAFVEQRRPVHLTGKPTPAMSPPERPVRARAPRTASPVARHQSSGSCSAQPGRGDAKAMCSAVAEPTSRPPASMTSARVPPVPTSMPRKTLECDMARMVHHGSAGAQELRSAGGRSRYTLPAGLSMTKPSRAADR